MSDGQFIAPTVKELQTHFTQFAIEAFVAVGGMGAVYRAKQISVDRTVALKVLPPELAQDSEFRARFAMEARAMAKLSHRNLVQLYDFGQDGEVVWMTQEWVDGRTVLELLEQEGAMDPKEAAALVAQACEGLGYAHKQGIVHRDVKPGNMMEGEEGLLKVMDFGLARAMSGGPAGLRARGGARYATKEYAAPELWDRNREVDHRVDIFALGVLLFETLTGQRPGAQFRKPSELRPGLDRRFDDIVVRALQRKPENRFGTCAEFIKALRVVVTPPAKAPAKASTGKVKLMTGSTGAVKIAKPLTQPATQAVAVSSRAPQRRQTGAIGVAAVVLMVLAIVGGGGWLWWAKEHKESQQEAAAIVARQEEAARQSRAERERNRRERKVAAEARKKKEEQAREAAARKAEEERKRLAAMKAEQAAEANKDPAARVMKGLQQLDAATREAAKDPMMRYRSSLADLTERFVTICDAGEKEAAAAADLDRVIFWMKERAGVERGNPGEGGEEAPDGVATMRTEWDETLVPLVEKLEELRSGYLEKTEALGDGDLPDETRDVLAKRWKDVSHLAGFMDFCDGTDPREPENVEVPPVVPVVPLPDKLRVPYENLQKTLVDLDAKGDRGKMQSLITSFGRGLAAEQKKLTMALQIPEAVAVRTAKTDLLEKLQRLQDGGSLLAEAKGARLHVVRSGSLTDDAEVSGRAHWKRKGLLLESADEEAWLRSTKALGKGDFVVRLRMAVETIGSTFAAVSLGETQILLDNNEGHFELTAGGVQAAGVTGKQTGSLIKAGEPFDMVVERKGMLLQVMVNGKEALQSGTHDREIGALKVRGRGTALRVESGMMEGALIDRIPSTRLTWHNHPGGRVGRTELVGTGNNGLVCLFHTYGGGSSALYAARSRNGEKWEDYDVVIDQGDLNDATLASMGVVANPDRDVIWVAYTVGESNQRVFLTQGRSRGRNWSKSVEITEDVKPGGRFVWLCGRGIVLEKNKRKEGRILIPMMERGEQKEQILYVMVSERGRDWKRIGPVMRQCDRGAEIIEGAEGRIWLATGATPKERSQFHRRWVVSEDGGDTWSEPGISALPDTGMSDGDVVKVDAGRGQVIWYYATTEGPLGVELPPQTNLTLYGSKDRGKTWSPLRRFFYGRGKYPSIVPLGPDHCAVAFRKDARDWGAQEVRVIVLEDLWKK